MKNKKSNKLKQIKSTQAFSPIRDVRDGIIITKDGRFVKILEFTPINFGLRSNSEQASIISQFVAVIRSMPRIVQFKVVSKKSDVSKFIEKVYESMKTETSEKCRKLQEEQLDLIIQSSDEGVSRRFFIAFAYEEQATLQKRPSFEKIAYELNREAMNIVSTLEQCGNELISVEHSDRYTLSVLYSIMCRSKAEKYSFEDIEDEVVARYMVDSDINLEDNVHIPINEFICPSVIETNISPKYIVIDGTYYTYCYLPSSTYPTHALGGWITILINMGVGIDVDFWFKKESIASIQRKLQYKLRYNKVKMNETEDTSQDFDDLSAAIDSGYYLKQGISNGEDFCYMATMITITAKSLEELNYKYEEVKNHCIKNDLKIKQCLFQQQEAFISSLPLAQYNNGIFMKSRRNVLSSSLASCYPFVSFEMTDENGILLGVNSNNGSLVFVDHFDTSKYSNANIAILGSSGAGKTYTLQSMALRLRAKHIQTFVIAPLKGFEFERACEAVGGTFVKIAPGSGNNINIMEIRKKDDQVKGVYSKNETAKESILLQKIQQLHTFFSLLIEDISFAEKQVLDEALLKTYEGFGITARNKSLLDPNNPDKYKKMPILGDLHKILKDMGPDAKRLYDSLTRYVSGSAKSFNQQTNVNLDNMYIVLDVSTLTKEMLPIGMFIALEYVYDKIKENRTTRKTVFIDETWKLIGPGSSEQAAEFVLEIFKTIRGYGGSAIAATQDLNDFFALANGKFGKGIINNSKIKMLMKTEPNEAKVVAEAMDLTQAEFEEIKTMKRGKCLLAANSNHIFIDIKTSRTEHDLITTDAKDLERIENESKFI